MRIVGANFRATAQIHDGKVIEASKPVRWLVGKPVAALIRLSARWRWKLEPVNADEERELAAVEAAGAEAVPASDVIRVSTQQLLDELEAKGILVRNGKMQRGRSGKLHPVYVLAPKYAQNIEAAAPSEFALN